MRSPQFVLLIASMALICAGMLTQQPVLMALALLPLFMALVGALFFAKDYPNE